MVGEKSAQFGLRSRSDLLARRLQRMDTTPGIQRGEGAQIHELVGQERH